MSARTRGTSPYSTSVSGAAQCGFHLFAAVAMNHANMFGRQFARGIHNMTEQGFAGEGMQHLGQIGVHPFALAGGENHDLKAHGKIIAERGRLRRILQQNKKGQR